MAKEVIIQTGAKPMTIFFTIAFIATLAIGTLPTSAMISRWAK